MALTHIFCGQINSKGKAEGFHSRPGNKNPSCAKATGTQSTVGALLCYPGEEVYDAKNIKWVPRATPPSKRFCFFPKDWSIATTVSNIQKIYNHCKSKIDSGQICGRNYKRENFDVILFLKSTGGTNYEVVSSFATPSQDVTCKVNCDLSGLTMERDVDYFRKQFSIADEYY